MEKPIFEIEDYFDGNEILTYNCLFNFITGSRGAGKTFWGKKRAVLNFLKDGSQFIYVRRYAKEIRKAKKNFFHQLTNEGLFTDHEFSIDEDIAYIDGQVAGYFVTLSTAKILKSVSYPKVTFILFDEFLIEKSNYRYLPNEVEAFLDLYETVARTRENVIVFFMSNAITFTNPYFLYFDIKYPQNKKKIFRRGEIFMQLFSDEEFKRKKKQTRFGSIIDGTRYGSYSIDNDFLLDSTSFIEKKGEAAKYYFTFFYKDQSFGVWIDYKNGKLFISSHVDPSCRIQYSLTTEDHRPNMMLIKNAGRNTLFRKFIDAYKNGYCYFESMKIKNMCYDIIKMMLT